MNLNIVDGVKNRITPTPSNKQNKTIENSINYINICFFKYLKDWIKSDAASGGLSE